MALTTTPKSVKDEIDESLKPDNKLTSDEMKKIDLLYDKVETEEGKKEVKDYIKTKLSGDTETELLKLLENVEVIKGNFTMETLAKNSKSELFNKILKKESALLLYKTGFILPIIKDNKDLFVNGQDTLEIIYWKKITDEIGLKSAMGMVGNKITGFFSGIAKSISDIGNEAESEKDMDLSKMGDLVDKLQKIGDKPDNEGIKKLGGIMGKLKGYLDYMTRDYTNNLNTLIKLGKKQDKDGLQKLLDNPVALDEVLKTGRYNKDGYNIDLENEKVSFNSNPSITKSKTEFMKLAVDATNKNGKTLDLLSKKTKQLAKTFEKLGFKSDDLRSFRDGLKEIPIIGDFLFALVSLFLGDKVLNLMDKNPWEKEFETSGKNLQAFIKDNKGKLPFTVGDEDFEDVKVSGKIESFLEKVKDANKQNFNNIQANKEQSDPNYKKLKLVSLIDNKDFWKTIFSEDEPADPILKQLWNKAEDLKDDNLSIEEFFEKLNKGLVINITSKKAVISQKQKEPNELEEKEAKKLNSDDKDLLISEIEKITSFPADIKIKDSAGIEKELKLEFTDSKLLLNDKDFVLKDGEISEIKSVGTDIILKIKNSTLTESEKKISKSEFAKIIAGLAVGSPVIDSILITPKNKLKIIQEAENIAKKAEITKKKTELEAEQATLTAEIKQLRLDLKPDSEFNKELTKINLDVTNLEKSISDKKVEIDGLKKEKSKNLILLESLKIEFDDLNEEAKGLNFYNLIDSANNKANLLKNSSKTNELIKKNVQIDKDLDSKLKNLESENSKLIIKKQEQTNKKAELDKKKSDLSAKETRIGTILVELGTNKSDLEAYNKKVKEQKLQRKADEKALDDKIKADKKALEDAEKAAVEAEENKPFTELLENPTKIEDLKLTLSNGSEITFDKNDNTINFGGEKFGVKDISMRQKFLIKMFSFDFIYKNKKSEFIKVLSDLEKTGKAILDISDNKIEFEKIV